MLEPSYLEFGAHAGYHFPENLHANLEDLGYRTDRITTQTETEILCNGLYEGGGIVRGTRIDDCMGRYQERHVVVQDGKHQMERQKLRTHGVRLQIPFTT